MPGNPFKKELIYGLHAVENALRNRRRCIHKIYVIKEKSPRLDSLIQTIPPHKIIFLTAEALAQRLPHGAVSQGIALETEALPQPTLPEMQWSDSALVVVLDSLTDPQNVGSIIRAAAAFGVTAILHPHHNAPALNSLITKIASGGVEHVPIISVSNISQSIDILKKNGFWCYGLTEHATTTIYNEKFTGRVAIITGSEGQGLRKLTQTKCDICLALPTNPHFPTLNAGHATTLALYEVRKQLGY